MGYPRAVILLLPGVVALWSGCASSCSRQAPCDDPRVWYSPTSDLEVEFACESPGPGWRRDPFIAEVGVDLDGRLRGPKGVFTSPTADTGLGAAGALGPLPPVDEGPPDTGLPFGPTADTFAPFGPTGDTMGDFVGPALDADTTDADQTDAPEPEAPPEDTGPGDDTGLQGDTFATGATGATGDTGIEPLPTADTGPFPIETGDTGVIE